MSYYITDTTAYPSNYFYYAFFTMTGILGDKVSSCNTWPFYLTAGGITYIAFSLICLIYNFVYLLLF